MRRVRHRKPSRIATAWVACHLILKDVFSEGLDLRVCSAVYIDISQQCRMVIHTRIQMAGVSRTLNLIFHPLFDVNERAFRNSFLDFLRFQELFQHPQRGLDECNVRRM